MKSVIVTSQGFLKGGGYSKEENRYVITYTHTIQEAKTMLAKTARNYLKKYGITGFVWNLREEVPYRNLYEVRKDKDGIYRVYKAMMVHYSDADFIKGLQHPLDKYMGLEAAMNVALHKNAASLHEIEKQIKALENKEFKITYYL